MKEILQSFVGGPTFRIMLTPFKYVPWIVSRGLVRDLPVESVYLHFKIVSAFLYNFVLILES